MNCSIIWINRREIILFLFATTYDFLGMFKKTKIKVHFQQKRPSIRLP